MTTISGICRDAAGDPVAGRLVRVERLDTGAQLGSALSSDGATLQGGDPNYSNVSLLLHGNGENNSTTFTDSGPDARTVTRNGTGVVISTAQSKHSGSSIYFPGGSGDYLTVAAEADFNFGTGDFTIEFWAYATKSQPLDFLNFMSSGATRILIYYNSNELKFWDTAVDNFGGSYTWPSSGASWVHFAFCRGGTTLRGFAGGAPIFSAAYSSSTPSGCDVHIGRSWTGGSGREFGGYLQDLRIKKGEALYTSAFTPPEAKLPGAGEILPAGEYQIDCGIYTGDVVVYQYDPADLTIRPQIHISEPA